MSQKDYYHPRIQLGPPFRDYFVTREGHVISHKRTGPRRIGSPGMEGYEKVTLCAEGKNHYKLTHRLICEAYHGPQPSDQHIVAHLNGDPLDNRPENLRWSLPEHNRLDDVTHRAARALRQVRKFDQLPRWAGRPSIRELVEEVRKFEEYVSSIERSE